MSQEYEDFIIAYKPSLELFKKLDSRMKGSRQHEWALKEFGAGETEITQEVFEKVVAWLEEEGLVDSYHNCYRFFDTIRDDKELSELFGFEVVDTEWDEDGAEHYRYYRLSDLSWVIGNSYREIEKHIRNLRKRGVGDDKILERIDTYMKS